MDNKEKIKRYRVFLKVYQWTEVPMIFLGFVWLIFLVIELIGKLTPLMGTIVNVIWIIFIVDFFIKLIITPERWKFLKKNTLTIISLFIPAFRIFRVFAGLRILRSLGFIRSVRVIRVVSSVNRGMRVLSQTLERKAFNYVLILSLIIAFVGAAAIYAFEEKTVFSGYLDALYWTTMMISTMGSGYWPQSPEGKVIALLLSFYALGVLGYFTAMLSSFLIGRDAQDNKAEIAGAKQIKQMNEELKKLREEISNMKNKP